MAASHRHHPASRHPVSSAADSEDGAASTPVNGAVGPATTPLGPVDTVARWVCITDYDTGAVLMEKAADEHMAPSSLTKMMTAYIVFAMLRAGRIHLDQTFTVSERAWRMQGSKMFVPLDSSVSVENLIQGMLIQSGNDACVVLAEGISGSEEQFVVLMNDTAAKLGMTNSHFMNVTGWPAENHYMSARDTATIASHLIRDFPEYYHYFSEKDFEFNHISQGNRNVLVDKGLADGLKTGHTDAGGYGLCASSLRDGRRVVMALNGMASSNERAHEGERLLAWAFASFEKATLLKAGENVAQVPVWNGVALSVPGNAGQDLSLTLPRGWQSRVHISADYSSPVKAPVSIGQKLGTITVQIDGGQNFSIPMVAGAATQQLSFGGRISRKLGLGAH
ncbi:MAG: D-alanyl-D-alanine carboxypeptidase family protein [Acetobacter sp.]|jgi:D-alanyl-D-alanine carboxypeptidase (penicillin-binding protein 5/6)|nr:D-alanyl-D-alanine carboxypeptidase [Acetobacter sp.]MCH4061054.1 D-alanyl-D-alanine carboxypeptidase [Acetobacter sp.]MCH4087993.1 D-alanyl-D-alanine carboxypeptidase [Acetobacter sp.]MCI1293394.1 D-alanyl-D-alanine carboxypeptidase [Acetobacter sp.]MCI1319981.1 D-alanyl-D-alanine carboxypeptidase [Acetobacter sp.]